MTVSFDELMKKAKDVALTAGKIAGDVVGEVVDGSKAKLAEAKLNAQIAEVNERLGMIVYEAAKTGKDSLKLQEMLIKELDTLYQALEELRKKTTVSGVEIFCPQCGEKNPNSATFCTKCGSKLAASDESHYAVEAEIEAEVMEVTDVVDDLVASVEEPDVLTEEPKTEA